MASAARQPKYFDFGTGVQVPNVSGLDLSGHRLRSYDVTKSNGAKKFMILTRQVTLRYSSLCSKFRIGTPIAIFRERQWVEQYRKKSPKRLHPDRKQLVQLANRVRHLIHIRPGCQLTVGVVAWNNMVREASCRSSSPGLAQCRRHERRTTEHWARATSTVVGYGTYACVYGSANVAHCRLRCTVWNTCSWGRINLSPSVF